MVLCVVGRASFLYDFYSDVNVTRQLMPAHPKWAALGTFFLFMPYVIMLCMMGRPNFMKVLDAMASDAGSTVSHAVAYVVGEANARDSCRAKVSYFLLGVPILFSLDLYLNFRYFAKEPFSGQIFNYMKLRGLCDVAENIGQLALQSYIFTRQSNPCHYLPDLELEMVNSWMLAISMFFSAKSLLDGRIRGKGGMSRRTVRPALSVSRYAGWWSAAAHHRNSTLSSASSPSCRPGAPSGSSFGTWPTSARD